MATNNFVAVFFKYPFAGVVYSARIYSIVVSVTIYFPVPTSYCVCCPVVFNEFIMMDFRGDFRRPITLMETFHLACSITLLFVCSKMWLSSAQSVCP